MAKLRTLFWLVTAVAVGIAVWRWQQRRQSTESLTGFDSNLGSPPGSSPDRAATPLPPIASPYVETPSTQGPRRIPTRVHKGVPPTKPSKADELEPSSPAAAPILAPTDAVAEGNVAPSEPLAPPESVAVVTEQVQPTEPATPPAPDDSLLNINTASIDDLIALPGIGPSLAKRIIEYRDANGPFQSIEGLIEIQGIGPNNINDFAHLVIVK